MTEESLRILLIEDVPIYVGMLERVLATSNLRLNSVGSLKEGLEAAATGNYNVVLLDLGLPDSYGLKTFTTFVDFYPDLPVVILTGTNDEEMAAKAVHHGAQDYLIKGPYLMREDAGKRLLIRSLRYAVERYQIQSILMKERDLLEFRVAERTSELKHTNEHLTALIDAVPDLLCRINHQGIVLDLKVPQAFSHLFENPDQIIGSRFSESFSSILTEKGIYYYRKAIKDGEIQVFENEFSLNGGNHHFEFRILLSPGSDVLVLMRDVTESKALERMWRRYEFIANTSKDLLILIDREYRYQAVNDAYCQENFLTRENIIGETFSALWGKDVFEKEIKPHVDKCFTGKVHTTAGKISYGPLHGRYFEQTYYPYFSQEMEVTNIVVVSRDRTEYRKSEEMLTQYNKRLRYLATQLVSAQEEERRRISLELHDEAGQALTAIKLKLALVQKQLSPVSDPIQKQLGDAISLVEGTMDQIRRLAHNLRPPALDAVGLNQAMDDYCQRFSERSGINVSYIGVDIPELPSHIQINYYRMLQEALTNVVKHAAAVNIYVDLRIEGGNVILKVMDDGIGFDPQVILERTRREGIGLAGIEERMEALGGVFEIRSDSGLGTTLFAKVPWKEAV